MLPVNINNTPSIESPLVQLHLTFVILKGYCQGHSDFESLSRKGAELGQILLLDATMKPYIWSPIALSHLTLSDLERPNSRSPDFEALYLVKEKS